MSTNNRIIYTKTDEAPALATHSFLPIVKAFTNSSGIIIETKDISLGGRILANFSDFLNPDQQINDALAELGELVKKPEANIIKLPNISASTPQLKAAISELQQHGYAIPDYPDDPKNEYESVLRARYDKIKGSAVNPVLREGNSDRRAPKAVKNFAKKNPHSMGAWSPTTKSHVSTMDAGDFCHNEKSMTMASDDSLTITFTSSNGDRTTLKKLDVLASEIIDASVLSKRALYSFIDEQISDAK
ncbi:UNVERIFIED_CONTAM: hypothetical protein GTU68_033481, partial [Idotea baltica]|nr:hypothetical protein [Idotea baltica]